jgi:hypothetical protein
MTVRTALVALVAAVGTALIIGIPTDVVPNPWFAREIGVRAFDVVVLIALSVVTGALVATYTLAAAFAVRVRAIRRKTCPLPRDRQAAVTVATRTRSSSSTPISPKSS